MSKQIAEIKQQELFPGIKAQFVHTINNTIGFVELEQGAILPTHSHIHEQTTHVIEGLLELTINGNVTILTSGMIVTIPSNIPHSARALSFCKVTDIFFPVREDYL